MIKHTDLPFRQLVEAAPDGMVVCDKQGKIVLVNGEAERMFGYAREELLGQRIELLVPERMRDRHEKHVDGFTHKPKLRPMGSGLELSGRRKDGSEFPVEISLSPVETTTERFITAGIRDVSERKGFERDARRANAYLVSAVDSVQEAFALFDEQDRVMMVNSAARQLLGGQQDEAIVGRHFDELLRDALASGVFDFSNETRESLLERWLAYHRAPSGTLDVRTGTGRYLRVTEHKTAEHGTVTTIADVTDDVQRAEELERARRMAEAASAAKSEFLSSMSHELRTPLNAILGFAQLLERDRRRPLDERQLERLQHVMRGGEHLLRLIDDVLDLSRIEAGRISVSTEAVDATEVIAEVVKTLEPMAHRAQIAISAVAGELPSIAADRTRLAQILMNFGSNAIKYGKPGGHVTVRTERRANAVRICVIDDGIGIPADRRDKIFEPFQRAGQETGPIEGTGIGLTISKRLAELMHASIGFTSEVDRGSEFWIDVPVHHALANEARPDVHGRSAGASALATGVTRHKVVYVEDNPSNIAFMREVMDDLATIDLLTAPNAELGIELIRAHRPEVVIMDINLPGMSGIEAVRRLHESPETRDIPVIGLSAAALVSDTKRAKDAGFYRYLTKPVKVDELTAVLEALLARP
jgi:PAS domain S-box-containing protein